MRNTITLLTDRRKTAVWALVIALLAATLFTSGGTASANETIATATNLGNWTTIRPPAPTRAGP